MTDQTTTQRSSWGIVAFLRDHFQPNRIAVYLAAVAALAGGLAPAVANLDLTSTTGVLASVIAIVSVVRKWLEGWQQMEAADYQAQLSYRQHVMVQEQRAAAADVGRPGSRASRVSLPR